MKIVRFKNFRLAMEAMGFNRNEIVRISKEIAADRGLEAQIAVERHPGLPLALAADAAPLLHRLLVGLLNPLGDRHVRRLECRVVRRCKPTIRR